MKSAGIAGAGLVGRLLALKLLQKNWKVTLFDKDVKRGYASCGVIAAGMLAPFAEVETAESIIFDLGIRSISLWPSILSSLLDNVYFQVTGSLIVSHQSDLKDLEKFTSTITRKIPDFSSKLQFLTKSEISLMEPELDFSRGILIPFEGSIDNHQLFLSLEHTLTQHNVVWHEHTVVNRVDSGEIVTENLKYNFDMVFDCRGFGAREEFHDLRGVRGELFVLHAPNVNFKRPIRLIHPRYNIYLVPRPDNIFVIGASEIESNDMSPISVQSSLELLSSAYYIHKGFSEARIINMFSNCRPAFYDNLPRIYYQNGIVRINGLYRHGYLIAPAIIEEVMLLLDGQKCKYGKIIF